MEPMPQPAVHRIDVFTRAGGRDVRGEQARAEIAAAGFPGLERVEVSDLYFVEGDLAEPDIERLVRTLLQDDILEDASWRTLDGGEALAHANGAQRIEITPLPGVTDSAAESLKSVAEVIGMAGIGQVSVGRCYTLHGALDQATAQRIADGLLVNAVVQTASINQPIAPPFVDMHARAASTGHVETVPLRAADGTRLLAISKERRLSLDLAEMTAIQAWYKEEGREPTDVELEMLAQTWSEHCVHKTFRARITFTGAGEPGPRVIDGLLKTYIRAATEKINKPWVRSAFVDNAGVIAFDDKFDLAFKVETHNHPSALEPFGGANTGVGGVVRDVIGVSARPIANTDVLCFGPQDLDPALLPDGVLHPRRIAEGVTAGIEDYGNKMGIPTVNGAFCYHSGYTANPLVFCGCLGIVPVGAHPRTPRVGDLVVSLGGRTGRDGLRGATFSSMEMGVETAEIAGSSVQIGHPIHEKQALEAVMQARDERLYTAITDCGAGGLSSAVGEMAAELGAVVHLERVPLKYPNLEPWEIWLSEAQERMVLAVPPANWPRLQAICDGLDVEATALGEFSGDGRVKLLWRERIVGNLATAFLHDGIPRMNLNATWTPPAVPDAVFRPAKRTSLTDDLLDLLRRPGTRSNENVVRRYDHEVQGGTVVKPFVGIAATGPSDAAVLSPAASWRVAKVGPVPGVALAVGINPEIGIYDPYAMAWAAIDEAIRNCIAVGADPDRIAILDNFCWGNPRLPDRLGSLVRACEGCYDAADAYGTPFVSGKDSLNNEYLGADGQKHAIPGTLLISAMGIVPDVTKTVTSDFKAAGNFVYLLGVTRNEMEASTFWLSTGRSGGSVPRPPEGALESYRKLHLAIQAGLVRSCHDCSEGGLALAVAEMAMGGGLGVAVDLAKIPQADDAGAPDVLCFSESLGRLIIEVAPGRAAEFERIMKGADFALIGDVRAGGAIHLIGPDGKLVIATTIAEVEHAFRGHLMEAA